MVAGDISFKKKSARGPQFADPRTRAKFFIFISSTMVFFIVYRDVFKLRNIRKTFIQVVIVKKTIFKVKNED